MTSAALTASPGGTGWRLPGANSAVWPLTLLVLLLAGQLGLIFVKSFNWDEFLHYSKVYQLEAGSLTNPFQTLLARTLAWAPDVSRDLMTQMLAARIFAWSAFLVGLGSLYCLARRFVPRADAAWTTLVYLAAGTVFTHGFAIRTDPIAMAALMLALYMLASRRMGWAVVLAAGALVGFAGMLTVKSVFYAPCFAGIAWLRISETDEKRSTLVRLGAVPVVAAATFIAILLLHRAGLAPAPSHQQGGAFLANGMQWLTQGLIRQPEYTLSAIVTAPVFAFALIKSPSAWRKSGLDRDKRIALGALCLPLIVILFYRNVFPYFFTFILAPVAVAIAPAVAELRRQYGAALLAAALCLVPLTKLVTEPREVLGNQRAMIDYVHRQFPMGALSLDDCGMVADYPRVVSHLLTDINLANYRKRGVPLVAKAVESGRLAFVIDNQLAISLALAGETGPETLLPADVAALHGNYVRAWGTLWLAGEEIPEGPTAIEIDVPAGGAYVADGAMTVDGVRYGRGDVLALNAGRHVVLGPRTGRAVLWRGQRLPAPPPETGSGLLFTNF